MTAITTTSTPTASPGGIPTCTSTVRSLTPTRTYRTSTTGTCTDRSVAGAGLLAGAEHLGDHGADVVVGGAVIGEARPQREPTVDGGVGQVDVSGGVHPGEQLAVELVERATCRGRTGPKAHRRELDR